MNDISAGKKVTDAFANQIHLYGKPDFKRLDDFITDALKIANKRIDELEKYNLDLANESHNKSERIKGLELDLGLAKIALDQKSTLLNSCEIALEREQFPPK